MSFVLRMSGQFSLHQYRMPPPAATADRYVRSDVLMRQGPFDSLGFMGNDG